MGCPHPRMCQSFKMNWFISLNQIQSVPGQGFCFLSRMIISRFGSSQEFHIDFIAVYSLLLVSHHISVSESHWNNVKYFLRESRIEYFYPDNIKYFSLCCSEPMLSRGGGAHVDMCYRGQCRVWTEVAAWSGAGVTTLTPLIPASPASLHTTFWLASVAQTLQANKYIYNLSVEG